MGGKNFRTRVFKEGLDGQPCTPNEDAAWLWVKIPENERCRVRKASRTVSKSIVCAQGFPG